MTASIGEALARLSVVREALARPSDVPAMMRQLHGVEDGDACPGCGVVLRVGALERVVDACPSCGRPWPRRCYGRWVGGEHVPCDALVEPVRSGRAYREPGQCDACRRADRRDGLRAYALTVLPPPVHGPAADVYEMEHRLPVLDALRRWWEGDGPPALYLHGSTGSGKTVLAAHAVLRGLLAETLPRPVRWVTEHQLVRAAKRMFHDDAELHLLDDAAAAPVLVVDDLFSNRGAAWTQHVGYELGELFATRFEGGRRTLVASNEPAEWGRWTSRRVESRFRGVGGVVDCVGPDLRAAMGGMRRG